VFDDRSRRMPQRGPACTKENCSWPRSLIQHRYLLSPKQLTARGPNPHRDDHRLVNAVSGAGSRSAYAVGGKGVLADHHPADFVPAILNPRSTPVGVIALSLIRLPPAPTSYPLRRRSLRCLLHHPLRSLQHGAPHDRPSRTPSRRSSRSESPTSKTCYPAPRASHHSVLQHRRDRPLLSGILAGTVIQVVGYRGAPHPVRRPQPPRSHPVANRPTKARVPRRPLTAPLATISSPQSGQLTESERLPVTGRIDGRHRVPADNLCTNQSTNQVIWCCSCVSGRVEPASARQPGRPGGALEAPAFSPGRISRYGFGRALASRAAVLDDACPQELRQI
jgi:hypothetical protein